ncbi:MAG: NAD(+)/NADH kinase [Alphaproteobacteria bacterium]|nr:NAD(+)/NADH kinase [Alphaproteobacteria bacterium]
MKIHFVISPEDYAQEFGKLCIEKWGQTNIFNASYVVSLGGDGTALLAQHKSLANRLYTGRTLPVYNIDCSDSKHHYGILTNKRVKDPSEIEECILDAQRTKVYPLQADCELLEPNKQDDSSHIYYGFNEIAVKIQDFQMTHLEVKVNNGDSEIVEGDGCILATYMGKNGYYHNLGGKDFDEGYLGFQTIASRKNINRIIPQDSTVAVKVISHHRPASVMRDCNLVSHPISKAIIKQSDLPLIVLKDRVREN